MWSAFGALAFAGDAALHAGVAASPWLAAHDWAIAPSVLMLAGAFQFSSLKDACLRACRHPASFLRRHYRRGPRGGLALGVRHAAFCVGCCWALMLVMFAAGAASLIWMAALTALMVHEKTQPDRRPHGAADRRGAARGRVDAAAVGGVCERGAVRSVPTLDARGA